MRVAPYASAKEDQIATGEGIFEILLRLVKLNMRRATV